MLTLYPGMKLWFPIIAVKCKLFRDASSKDTPCGVSLNAKNGARMLDLLQKLWLPFWQRDREEDQWDESSWTEAQEFTNTFCPQAPIALAERVTLPEWLAAVKKTSPSSAKGSCGFSRGELLQLPHAAHEDLLDILHDITLGSAWPTVLTTARTVFLRKGEHDLSPHSTRPITVFALIYRAWAKAWVSKALRQLATVAPRTLAGGLPHTSTSTVWWWLQEKLEQLQFRKRQAFGFNLDLLKCFKLMGRASVTMMLTHFGVPTQITTAWLRAMMQSARVLQIAHQHSLPVPSTTGVPEGDPVGVLAMALLGATWIRAIESTETLAFAYADNLEFLADDFDKAEKVLDMSVVFAEASSTIIITTIIMVTIVVIIIIIHHHPHHLITNVHHHPSSPSRGSPALLLLKPSWPLPSLDNYRHHHRRLRGDLPSSS